MTVIHLIGSEGFIGRAVQRQARDQALHCWSHGLQDSEHHFNLLDSSTWTALLNECPTHVILLSWPGLPNYREPFHITRNLPASIELVGQLAGVGMQRLVVAGTCYEYGLQNGALRTDQSTDPINSYAIAKDTLRRAISSLTLAKKVTWSWLRIFYPFGVGQNPKSLLPALQLAIEKGHTVFPMSSGRQLRDFVPVEDVASQLLLLAMHPLAQGIYNGGSGSARSIREIVEDRICQLDSCIKLDCGAYPDREDEPLAFWADMSRMSVLK